ncbi:deoxynucleotide monophosphate kinase protein [Rhizobium phage RHph_X2_24]|nr:deoxynucleotide monophosphate kinase protein [Rhizobium phage RHph_X2_24]
MIIGICGYKGAGKSTVCEVAVNVARTPYSFKRMGFADPMYDMFRAMGVPDDFLYAKERWDEPLPLLAGKTLRYAMTTLGTEWGRDMLGENVWTNIAIERARKMERKRGTPIIDNVRFPSEADALLAAGGVIIAFNRTGLTPDTRHISEQYIEEIQATRCGYRFTNPGDNLQATSAQFLELLTEVVR